MKLVLASLVACLALTTAAAGVVNRRFLLDDLTNLAHAVLDPLAGTVLDTVHTLVGEFDHLVHGNVDIHTVVCKLPTETTGSREDKIGTCTDDCITNASDYLGGNAADTAPEACPVACKYAYDHPAQVSC